MKINKTFMRLFMGNLLVMLVVIGVGGAVIYTKIDAEYKLQARQNQDHIARIAVQHFEKLWPMDQRQIDKICKNLLDDQTMRLTVVAADGTVLGDSNADPKLMVNHKTSSRPEILAALSGTSGSDVRQSGTLGISFRYVAMPLDHDGKIIAAVRLAVPVKAITENESFLRQAMWWGIITTVAAACFLGMIVNLIWYSPLKKIALAASSISSGDLTQKVRISGSGELAELAQSLNQMRQSLQTQLNTVAAQGQNLKTVLSNVREGIIATDGQSQIVLMNQSAGDVLSINADYAAGKKLQEVAPVLELLDFHNRLLESEKSISEQVEIQTLQGRRTFDISGIKVAAGPSDIRCVMVLWDITELASAAAMKTQFVANASHELRTPLATIRVAVDSLAATDPADRQEVDHLAKMLDRHVARLEAMVNDLLDLHQAESAKFTLRMQEISFEDLSSWIKSEFDAPAREKGITLEVALSPADSGHVFLTDRKLFELIIRNLIDNAIKFTDVGKVTCSLGVEDGKVCITVSDTGCGIRKEDQSRIFERFFQSDVARSGDSRLRGTGLGLAIVKHAAERLGATISLESTLGLGTTVKIKFQE